MEDNQSDFISLNSTTTAFSIQGSVLEGLLYIHGKAITDLKDSQEKTEKALRETQEKTEEALRVTQEEVKQLKCQLQTQSGQLETLNSHVAQILALLQPQQPNK
jgi:predicted RNase H-like nuclease (RuvC/YqgF family)